MRKHAIKHYLAMGILSTALGLVASTAFAQQPPQSSEVRRILPGVTDGDERVYTVRCRNGSAGAVVAKTKRQTFCATASSGKQRCSKRWSLRQASQHACKVSSR